MDVKTNEKQDSVISRLMRIYREFAKVRRVSSDSQMCCFWDDPTVEILIGSEELNALETEFGIQFDDDTALDLYDMTLNEAAILIENLIQKTGDHGL